MQSIDISRKVMTDGVQLFRPTKGKLGEYDAKDYFSGSKRGWIALDAFTASAILAVYNALNPENQARYGGMDPRKQASIAWKVTR